MLALRSALRRRGVAAEDGDLPDSVRAEHGGRQLTVRLTDGHWWRSMTGDPLLTIPVAPVGSEDLLARHLVSELLGRL